MNKSKRFNARASAKEYRAAVKAAKACDMGLAEYVRDAVRQYNERVEIWQLSGDQVRGMARQAKQPIQQPRTETKGEI
jgi:hypothetical protein